MTEAAKDDARSVVLLGVADRMLAEVATVDDARSLINLAEQARVYARQSKLGTSAINHATVIKIRAERSLADIVDEGQEQGEIADAGSHRGNQHSGIVRAADVSTLDDLGVERQRLSEARLLRDGYTDEDLQALKDQADTADEVLSRSALVQAARDQQRAAVKENAENSKIQDERVAILFPIYDALAALATCSLTPKEWAEVVLPASAYRVSDHIDAATAWLVALKEEWHDK